METKKDIYNLWIQYTTKNDEVFFRQFVRGFVAIWREQLHLELETMPSPSEIKPDSGPHIKRLPEELLPAIQKFLIIAKSDGEKRILQDDEIYDTTLLFECLTIICRHFDNIAQVARSNFVSVGVEIVSGVLKCSKREGCDVVRGVRMLVKTFSGFLEVIFDPFLTWRHFVNTDLYEISHHPNIQLNSEIIPFIYGCFEDGTLTSDSLNILGGVIGGSQINAQRAVCPATVKIIVSLISSWECEINLRRVALKCFNLMVIVLLKASPETRQIELTTVMQHYHESIVLLLKTKHFLRKSQGEAFEITDEGDSPIDVSALHSLIDNLRSLLQEPTVRVNVCKIMIDNNILNILIGVPNIIETWDVDRQSLMVTCVRVLRNICWASQHRVTQTATDKLFYGLRLSGKPSRDLVAELIGFTEALSDELFINCNVMREIIAWLGDFGEKEQQFAVKHLLDICTKNTTRKILACEKRAIEVICESLMRFQRLSPETISDMIRMIEELGKYTIHPVEVKKLFHLLREDFKFSQRFELLEAMLNISIHCAGNQSENRYFWNIQKNDEGITVQDVEAWSLTNPPNGFVFHTTINLERLQSESRLENPAELSAKAYRRFLLCLLSNQGTGFEIFVNQLGSLTLAALTKKEYHTVTSNEARLCDGQWHSVTVSVVPSKRPFSYFQVTMYRDQEILLSTSLKIGNHHEKFTFCTIGAPISLLQDTPVPELEDSRDNSNTMKGLFPSLFEKARTQAPNYFTLPLKGFSSQDPTTKCIALGLQESVFGSPMSLRGQMGCALLAESGYHLKNIVEAGAKVTSFFSQESESGDAATSKVVFCFSPSACCDSVCVDLSMGKKYTGHTVAKFHHVITIQDAVRSIGGIEVFLPLLECFRESQDWISEETDRATSESPGDAKNLKNPIAYLLILMRYCATCDTLQGNYENIALVGSMVTQCDAALLDVHVLVALQILIETVQQKHDGDIVPILDALYEHLLFNFRIWSRASFQIIIGHTQYLQTLVKTKRKYLRKKYGIQFILDTIRLYFITPNNIPLDDAKSIRIALLDIVKYYIQKEISIKEVDVFVNFLATGKNEEVLIEVLELLTNHMEANCKDQIFLLILEPQTAELLYCMLLERTFSVNLHNAVLKLIWCLLTTKWVSQRHKSYLTLQNKSIKGQSLYPGFLTYILSVRLEDEILLSLAEQMLSSNSESGYCGIVYLINNLQYRDLSLKLEISKKLITTVFTKQNSPTLIAQQTGWQQAFMKLLVKKSIKMDMGSSEVDFISFDDKTPVENREINFDENFSLSEAVDAMEHFENDDLSLHSTSTVSEINSLASPTLSARIPLDHPSTVSTVLPDMESTVSEDEQLVYNITNIVFTILWRGIPDKKQSSKAEGEIIAAVNFLALTNELFCSHLILRLRLLEMTVQACLIEIGEAGTQNLIHQEYCAQVLRMVYDLVVLDQNKEDLKKCSTKLLDGVLALLDALMVFQRNPVDDWMELKRVSLGLLLQCSHSSDPAIVAMATAKLHYILQCRHPKDAEEVAYLVFRLNSALENAIEVGNSEEYSFLIPVMKALLEKSEQILMLSVNVPDLPSLTSGPVFFHEFQMFVGHKQWRSFIKKRIEPLHDAYQKEIEVTLCEPLNTFWAECYESCKATGKLCKEIEMESRSKFQEKIILPWRYRQTEEIHRQNALTTGQKAEEIKCDRLYRQFRRSLYGLRGPWCQRMVKQDYWKLLNRENLSRMKMKLEPNLYHNPHTMAASLRDNTTLDEDRRLSADFGPAIIPSATPLDITDEEGFVILEEDLRFSQEVSITEDSQSQEVDREKIIVSYECELIVLMSRIKGKLEISANSIAFVDQSQGQQQDMKHDFRFPLALLRELHLRKYNLRRSALEMFLVDQRSFFVNLTTKTRNKVFSKILGLQPPNIQYGSGRTPSELLKASGLTQKWVNREISNFDYLMHLNTIAGRTHNDMSQYPIFPWILADYTSEILDLTDPASFRDLSKPIGVVNPKNEAEVRNKYENFEDPSGVIPKFHYGTHYSNSAYVLHYLLRMEPFTTLHVELQSGRFDVADRQFHSIAQTWQQLMDTPSDVKELIPEFFYMPDFLRNINGLDLGELQTTKEKITDVILPPWAQSPESFIAIHRRALESDYVSANLHKWIDLVFGHKQRGKAAIEALNVFYYCSYEGAVDLDKFSDPREREAIEGMINNFGQTPSQLLREAHPRRLTADECLIRLLRNELKRPAEFMNYLDRVSNVYCELSTEKDPVVYLSVPRTPQRSFLQTGPDVLISVTRSGVLSTHTWIPYDKERGFIFGTDSGKTRKVLSAAFHPAVRLSGKLFALNVEGKLLYTGGVWDCSLKVFSVHKGRAVASVVAHSDVITCLAIDTSGMHLVTGSRDCTCVLWSISNTNLTQNSVGLVALTVAAGGAASPGGGAGPASLLAPQPLKSLHGHESAISAVAIMTEFDTVASGSLDGTVNLYSIESGQLIRTVSPIGCTGVNIEISFVTISYQGHVAFSALDDTSYSVHAFTVNGIHVGSKYVSGRVTSLATINDLLVVSDDAGDITISRLNGLKPFFDISLHIPIESLVVVPGNSHLLAPLRDGNLAVVGVILPSATSSTSSSGRKHSILTV